MRIDVKKFLFIGPIDLKKTFFEKAQDIGIIDFIDASKKRGKEFPENIQRVIQAIKVLRGLPVTEQEELEDYSKADSIVASILNLKHEKEKKEEEIRTLRLEIARVAPFGKFSLRDLEFIEKNGRRYIQFFSSKKVSQEELPEDVIYIGSDKGLNYFISISKEKRTFDNMIEMKVDRPVDELLERKKEVEKELVSLDENLKSYSKYNTFLHHALTYKLNSFHLKAAESISQEELNGLLFAVTGWVPVNKVEELQSIADKLNIHYEEVAIEPNDVVPTYLENRGVKKIGEDLVHIYDTPSPIDRDPSAWVLLFFAMFFAFIVGDGGYGLILLCASLYVQYRYKPTRDLPKRIMKLSFILAGACIVWGLMTTSFFGIPISLDSPLRKVSLITRLTEKKIAFEWETKDEAYQEWVKTHPQAANLKDPKEIIEATKSEDLRGVVSHPLFDKTANGILAELALLIGIIHIILSMTRYIDRNWAWFGWILAIIGGYLYFPEYLKTPSMLNYLAGFDRQSLATNGLILLGGGTAIAVFLSLIQNKLMGILEIMTLVQIFADILSYLRLYALGLAGGIVSATVNELAGSVFFIAGIFIILLGHVINIALAIMGGVIHGLRLNFLEWYHYSFYGGGKPFRPLENIKVE